MANKKYLQPYGKGWRCECAAGFLAGLVFMKFPVNYSPMFAEEIIDKTETHIIYKDEYGVLNKNDINITSLPMELEHPVKDRKTWEEYKQHYTSESIKKRLPPDWNVLCSRFKTGIFQLDSEEQTEDFWGFQGK